MTPNQVRNANELLGRKSLLERGLENIRKHKSGQNYYARLTMQRNDPCIEKNGAIYCGVIEEEPTVCADLSREAVEKILQNELDAVNVGLTRLGVT